MLPDPSRRLVVDSTEMDPSEPHEFQGDIDVIARNPSIQTMLETVCLATGMRFAAIARVTENRWVTCRAVDDLSFGLRPGDELRVETTLCHEVRQMNSEIVIDDARTDCLYHDHHTPKQYGFRSYLSIPILRVDGSFFGTLCALDPEPARLSDPRVLRMARMFAKLIGETLTIDEQLLEARDGLARERHQAEVREVFMAILAHDLRNPVSAVKAGLLILARGELDEKARRIIALMNGSMSRMQELIDNLMDHARKSLGDGIRLDLDPQARLDDTLDQIVAEFRAVSPDVTITATFALSRPVNCDPARVAQLLANLLSNVVTHGAPGRPIHVAAWASGAEFGLSVANEGSPIPAEQRPTLFEPFHKGGDRPSREGLGLGLYIAAEIARAHGGEITVVSDETRNVFSFAMPT
jgi:signal transduction histidine kinase